MKFCLKKRLHVTLFCFSLMVTLNPYKLAAQDQEYQEIEQPNKPPVQPRPIKHTFVSPKLIDNEADEINHEDLNHTNKSTYEVNDPSNPLDPEIKKTNGIENFMKGFMNMMITVLLMVGTIYLIVWGFKRFLNVRMQQLNTTSNIKIKEKRVLSPKSTIYVIEVYDKQYIIAESPTGIHNLEKAKE